MSTACVAARVGSNRRWKPRGNRLREAGSDELYLSRGLAEALRFSPPHAPIPTFVQALLVDVCPYYLLRQLQGRRGILRQIKVVHRVHQVSVIPTSK